jgi:Uma2 family endonuclease
VEVRKLVTADELLRHPEWDPCELVRGKVIHREYAGMLKGRVCTTLLTEIGVFVKKHKSGVFLGAPTGVILERDPDTVRAPSGMFISKQRVPAGGFGDGYVSVPHDLVYEVTSPSDTFSDVMDKARSYITAGVRLVWVVDPQTKQAHVFQPGKPMATLVANESLSGEDVLPGFSLPLAEIFRQ